MKDLTILNCVIELGLDSLDYVIVAAASNSEKQKKRKPYQNGQVKEGSKSKSMLPLVEP